MGLFSGISGLLGIGGGGNSGSGNSGGLFGGGNLSPQTTDYQSSQTNQNDSRRVNTTGSGLSAIDGGTLNLTTLDGGAMALATSSVDQSMGLAKQIATTLGASIGQFGVGATGSIDGLANLLKSTNTSITGQNDKNLQLTVVALGVVGLIAAMSLRKK